MPSAGAEKTAGKARLTNMLRSGKELKVFAVKDSDLQLFCREAKKYGVLYCVLKDRDATDGLTDIMARAEDAGKINRIIERSALHRRYGPGQAGDRTEPGGAADGRPGNTCGGTGSRGGHSPGADD